MSGSNGKSGKNGKGGGNGAKKNGKPQRRFVVRNSKIHGRGVFAVAHIPKGSRLIEYKGRRITGKFADELYVLDSDNPSHTFLFSLDDGSVIDATYEGNSARWINHSCVPNCEAIGEDIDGKEHIFIEAKRDIRPGEELTYDYRITFDEPHTSELKRQHPCRCGTHKCRGTILLSKREARRLV
jgi:SET domain-containing protein